MCEEIKVAVPRKGFRFDRDAIITAIHVAMDELLKTHCDDDIVCITGMNLVFHLDESEWTDTDILRNSMPGQLAFVLLEDLNESYQGFPDIESYWSSVDIAGKIATAFCDAVWAQRGI